MKKYVIEDRKLNTSSFSFTGVWYIEKYWFHERTLNRFSYEIPNCIAEYELWVEVSVDNNTHFIIEYNFKEVNVCDNTYGHFHTWEK